MGIKTIPAFITEGRDLAYQTFSNPKYLSPLTQEEFKQLFDNYFDPIRNYIYYRSGNKELATDVTQEVFLRIWEKQPLFINGNAKALLYKIAGDIFVSEYRKQKTAAAFKVATAKTIATPIVRSNKFSSRKLTKDMKKLSRNYQKIKESFF